jgi:glutathione S-transferase
MMTYLIIGKVETVRNWISNLQSTSTTDLILYAYNFRSRAERVIWVLDELGLDFELRRLDPLKGETRTAAFTNINSQGKIPVLVHGDSVYTESLAIMEYLSDLVPEKNLVPVAPKDKYCFRKQVYYMVSEIEPYLWIADQATRLNKIYSWPAGTDVECIKRVKNAMPALVEHLSGQEFLAGSEFSIADIYGYHLISWAKPYAVEIPDFVNEYLARLEARPGCPAEIKPRVS